MEAQTATPNQSGQLLRDFVEAFDSVQQQLSDGIAQPVVPLSKISLLGTEGIGILKKHLEDSTQALFAVTVNASAKSVHLMPTGPMPAKPTLNARTLATGTRAVTPKNAGDKVPRPPNAFIIYRKAWHSRVVAQNPGLHNNAISVIIGNQWKAEAEEVRALYKQKAEDAKRQHELDHPDYQYQPRKPSEKKKRMTKNKLARLAKAQAESQGLDAVQHALPDGFDPIAMLDESLGACATYQPMHGSMYSENPQTQQPIILKSKDQDKVVFNSGPDIEDRLRASLQEYNAQVAAQTQSSIVSSNTSNPPNITAIQAFINANGGGNPNNNLPMPVTQPARNPAPATIAQQVIDGRFVNESPRFPLALSPATELIVRAPWAQELSVGYNKDNAAPTAQIHGKAARPSSVLQHNPGAEVERQDRLDEDFASFIDMNAYNSSDSPASDDLGLGETDAPAINFDMMNDEHHTSYFADNFELEFPQF